MKESRLTVRLAESLHGDLKAEAAHRHMKLQVLVRRILERGLAEHQAERLAVGRGN